MLKDIGIDLYAHGFNISSLFGVGLVYVYFQVPLMVILITPALEGLRPQWQEAAENLGASRLGLPAPRRDPRPRARLSSARR